MNGDWTVETPTMEDLKGLGESHDEPEDREEPEEAEWLGDDF